MRKIPGEPARPPDYEFALTAREVSQAIADFLVKQGRLKPDGRPSEATTLITGGELSAPSTYRLWLKGDPQ